MSRTQEDLRDIFKMSYPLGKINNEEVLNTIGFSTSRQEFESVPGVKLSGIDQNRFI